MKSSYLLSLIILAALPLRSQSVFHETASQFCEANASLKADSIAAIAALEEVRLETGMEAPEVEFEHLWSANPEASNRWSASIAQSFLFPTAYRKGVQLESATDRLLRLQAENSRRQLAAEAEELFITLGSAVAKLALQKQVFECTDSLYQIYLRNYSLGEVSILDINKLKIARAGAKCALIRDEAGIDDIRNSLQALAPESAMPSDSLLCQMFLTNAQSFGDWHTDGTTLQTQLSEAEIDRAEAGVSLAKSMNMPSFTLGYAHSYEENVHFNGFTVSVKLPSWESHAVKSARAKALETRFRQIALQAEMNARRDNLVKRICALEKILPLIEDALNGCSVRGSADLLLMALNGGEISVADYVTESNYLTQARIEYYDLKTELLVSMARLMPLK